MIVPPGVDKDGKQLPMDDTSKLTAQQSYVAKGQSKENYLHICLGLEGLRLHGGWVWKKLERELGGRRGGW